MMHTIIKSAFWMTSVLVCAVGVNFLLGQNLNPGDFFSSSSQTKIKTGAITTTSIQSPLLEKTIDKKLSGKALELGWEECNHTTASKRILGCQKLMRLAELNEASQKAARSNLAYALMETGAYEKAAHLFENLIEKFPGDIDLKFAHADNLQMQEEFMAARKVYTQALKITPKRSDLWVARAWTHFGMDEYKSALKDVNKAIRIERKNPSLYMARAQFYEAQKKLRSARKDYKKVLRLNKKNKEAKIALKRLKRKTRRKK